MKALKDHVIIYDDECPMCDLYTRGFIKAGMLEKSGREPYSWTPYTIARHIDKARAKNGIALVNIKTGNVTYGIDSLLTVIAHRFPPVKWIFSIAVFNVFLKALYGFISYNRRVIIPARKFEARNSCTPDFHIGYRWCYIFFCWLMTSWILSAYAPLVSPFIPTGSFYRELLICGGQIFFQGAIVWIVKREKIVHYLGNMMTVSMGGGLLLLPALLMASANIITTPWFYAAWFVSVVGLMLLEHFRRTQILAIHWIVSLSWVAYRFIVLSIIL